MITTIFPPTTIVRQLAALPGWCVVVVGDRKAPSQVEYLRALGLRGPARERFTYLDAAAQRTLTSRTAAALPWDHFGRKNLGFLHALSHGASLLYDTDDDNELTDGGQQLGSWADALETAAVGGGGGGARLALPELQTCALAANPYPPFRPRWEGSGGRAQFVWPRGFPLESVRSCGAQAQRAPGAANGSAPASARLASLGVVQSLASHDPDVDAIYRLTRHLPLAFARTAGAEGAGESGEGAFAMPAGTMAPFNAQATLWARPALWGLLLPISVHGRVSDIWRGYAAQRLLWAAGLRLAFAPPWVRQLRNPHSYLADFQSEGPLYERAGPLVRWLARWRPSGAALAEPDGGLPAALLELSAGLYELGVLEEADVELQAAWLADLRDAGYEFPRLVGAGGGAAGGGGPARGRRD